MYQVDAESAFCQVGQTLLQEGGRYPDFLHGDEYGDGHHDDVEGTVGEEEFQVCFRDAGMCCHGPESEKSKEVACRKQGDGDEQGVSPGQVVVPVKVMPQQEVAVEPGEGVEHSEGVPGTASPEIRGKETFGVGKEQGYSPQDEEE